MVTISISDVLGRLQHGEFLRGVKIPRSKPGDYYLKPHTDAPAKDTIFKIVCDICHEVYLAHFNHTNTCTNLKYYERKLLRNHHPHKELFDASLLSSQSESKDLPVFFSQVVHSEQTPTSTLSPSYNFDVMETYQKYEKTANGSLLAPVNDKVSIRPLV